MIEMVDVMKNVAVVKNVKDLLALDIETMRKT